jgi:hypothetical protein
MFSLRRTSFSVINRWLSQTAIPISIDFVDKNLYRPLIWKCYSGKYHFVITFLQRCWGQMSI